MGFLRRIRGVEPTEVPDWAAMLDARAYAGFIDAVAADFKRRGMTAEVDDGWLVVDRGEEEPYRFGLANLVQVCHATDRRDWPAVIATHFTNLLMTMGRDLDALAADYAQAARILRVRLMPDALGGLELEGSVTRPVAPGVQEVLVYDFPDSTANVHKEHLNGWPVDLEDAFRQGMANLAAEALPTPTEHDTSDVQLTLYLGQSFYVATRALQLPDFLPPGTTDAFVAVPTRHSMVVHPIVDRRALTSLSAIYRVALKMAQDGPGSISDQPYWWHDGSFTLVPHQIDHGKIVVVPPDALVAVLETVVG